MPKGHKKRFRLLRYLIPLTLFLLMFTGVTLVIGDHNSNISAVGIQQVGQEHGPDIPQSGGATNPRLWLIILAVSTYILRHELFFRKSKCAQYQE